METLKQNRITRGDMLKLGVLGSAALLLPLERTARTKLEIADRIPESRLPKPFQVPFATPPVLQPVRSDATTDYYEITQKSARVPILPGYPATEIYGYNGITPGPTIRAERGRQAVVRQINALPAVSRFGYETTTSTHLHGSASLPQYDGYAEDVTAPGFYKDYVYPNFQEARTIWYHDHGIHHTAENAYMGLAGFYIINDSLEQSLPIPHGRYDIPLVIRDAIFDTGGQLVFDDEGHSTLMGDVILVNGRPWPVMKVERRKYRFRLLNASLGRGYKLALSTGAPLTVIGTDGGLMPAPQQTDKLILGMSERYEIVIDFSKYPIGTKVDLRNLGLTNNIDFSSTRNVMRFEVVSEATDKTNNEVPAILNPGNETMKLPTSQAVRTRRFEFGRETIAGAPLVHETQEQVVVGGEVENEVEDGADGAEMWTINGKIWDPNRVDANPGLGDVEVWELINKSGGWFHPIHVHLIDFRILDRNGKAPYAFERGPKDVAYVAEGQKVRVLMKFGPQKGKYMIHCHNLTHEDHDMMTQFEVGTGGPDPVSAAPPRPISEITPL